MRKEFPKKVKLQAWERCGGYCETLEGRPGCGMKILGIPEYDHWNPAGTDGPPTLENCAVLCSKCHDKKTHGWVDGTDRYSPPLAGDIAKMAKADRVREKHQGLRKSKYRWGKRKFNQ